MLKRVHNVLESYKITYKLYKLIQTVVQTPTESHTNCTNCWLLERITYIFIPSYNQQFVQFVWDSVGVCTTVCISLYSLYEFLYKTVQRAIEFPMSRPTGELFTMMGSSGRPCKGMLSPGGRGGERERERETEGGERGEREREKREGREIESAVTTVMFKTTVLGINGCRGIVSLHRGLLRHGGLNALHFQLHGSVAHVAP